MENIGAPSTVLDCIQYGVRLLFINGEPPPVTHVNKPKDIKPYNGDQGSKLALAFKMRVVSPNSELN